MKRLKLIICPLLIWTFGYISSAAALEDGYREVSYDDLLQEISAKKSRVTKDLNNPFDNILVHAGIGYVNSFSSYRAGDNNLERYQNGIQLSVGVDLFSDHWVGEGAFRNFGLTRTGSEELYTKEIDLKIGYQNKLQDVWNWTASAGLATRYVTITDRPKNINVDDSTPSLMGSLGIKADVNKFISLSVETGLRSSLIQKNSDRYGLDLTFKIQGSM